MKKYLIGLTLPLLTVACMAAVIFHWLYVRNADVMWLADRLSLFVWSHAFFLEKASVAGGLLGYAGCFLTQFLHDPLSGGVVFTVVSIALAAALIWGFRLGSVGSGLAALPPLALTLFVTEMGYMVYVLKQPGYIFMPPVALLVIALLHGLFIRVRLSRPWAQATVQGVLMAVYASLYAFIGAYALVLVALCMLHSLLVWLPRRERRAWSAAAVCLIVGALSLAFVPSFYTSVFTGLNAETRYQLCLPYLALEGEERALWLPFVLILIALVVSAIAAALPHPVTLVDDKGELRKKTLGIGLLLSVVCLAAGTRTLWTKAYTDENFHHTCAALRAAEEGEWNDVVYLTSQSEAPSRNLVMLRNLALVKTGQAPDKLFSYADGDAACPSARPLPAARLMLSRLLYFNYGKIGFCYRWAMEDKVEYGLNADQLVYMARCAMVSGEWALARKYIATMKQTRSLSETAARYEATLGDSARTMALPEFKDVAPLMAYQDMLDNDKGMVEAYLLNKFMYMQCVNEEQTNLAILSALIYKSNDLFWRHLVEYARFKQTLPKHYQEAVLLFGHFQKLDVSQMPITPELCQQFAELVEMMNQGLSQNDAYNPTVVQKIGGTYWYYYFFVNGLQIN